MNAKDRRFVIAACLVSAVLGAAGSQLLTAREAWAQSATLRTQRMELIDAEGRLRGLISTTKKGRPFFALFTEERKLRLLASLSEEAESPLIVMNGSAGHDVIGLAVNGDDTAAINFSDRENNVRGAFTITRNGDFQIHHNDASGKATHRWPGPAAE